MNMIRSSNLFGGMFLSCMSFWIYCRKFNAVNPVNFFQSNSIASPLIPTVSWYDWYPLRYWTWPFHLALAPGPCSCRPTHRTESAWTQTFAIAHLIAWSLTNIDLLHDGEEQSKLLTFKISSECSLINFWVTLNTFSMFSNLVFCRFPNSVGNLVQDEWRLSSMTSWTIRKSSHLFCMVRLRT